MYKSWLIIYHGGVDVTGPGACGRYELKLKVVKGDLVTRSNCRRVSTRSIDLSWRFHRVLSNDLVSHIMHAMCHQFYMQDSSDYSGKAIRIQLFIHAE
jgi:hypothetical protein